MSKQRKLKQEPLSPSDSLRAFAGVRKFNTILADPPWQFQNRTGKVAPEHRRLARYGTLDLNDIMALPVSEITDEPAHLYLWVPNALLPEGLRVMEAWGFNYKSNIVWHKVRKDGGPDGRGVGFYFRNTTELVLFGVRGKNARTREAGRRQVNIIRTMKREHSRKPDELYDIIEACSWDSRLELFARGQRDGWKLWGDQADESYTPTWDTYTNNSAVENSQVAKPANSLKVLPPRKTPLPQVCASPDKFTKLCLRVANNQQFTATDAYDIYAAACMHLGENPVHSLQFWRALTKRAEEKGITKKKVGGRVTYIGARFSLPKKVGNPRSNDNQQLEISALG